MPATSRIGDAGVGLCACHPPSPPIPMTGVIISGASSHKVENSSVARIGDIVLGVCGHTGVLVGGSSNSKSEGSGIVRVGDSFVGCFSGVITTGAGSDNTGG